MTQTEKYNYWLENSTNTTINNQLKDMEGNEQEILDSFYQDLQFGTAGLRGIMGAGSNRLNYYTILRATQGVATYMINNNLTSAVITYDSRLNSREFAIISARTLATNGIKCYITEACQPTPFVSYLVSYYKCDMGINITASHNPSQYNGYKVYNSTGCQILDEQADAIMKNITNVDPFTIKLYDLRQCIENGTILYTESKAMDDFIKTILSYSNGNANNLNLTYTPLNGAGYKAVPRVLTALGANISYVDEQNYPDGNFTTCSYPNPEKAEAMKLSISRAKENNSDIVLGTDPDCDRLGVVVNHNGNFIQLSGNEVGILLTDYVLASLAEKRDITGGICVRTIVSSPLADKIADSYGAETRIVLTGFKYIGDVVGEVLEINQPEKFLLGWEESCGYLRGTHVKDKDAVVASMLVAEMAAKHKSNGLTLIDRLEQLYSIYGKFNHKLMSYTFTGATGAERKEKLLNKLRCEGLSTVGESQVYSTLDYLTGVNNLPTSNVLQFNCKDGTQLIVRPSGTEPLIKCYITIVGDDNHCAKQLASITKQLDELFK